MMGCIPEELLPFLAELVWRRSGCLLVGGFVGNYFSGSCICGLIVIFLIEDYFFFYLGGFVVCCVVLGIFVFVGGS